MKNGDCEDFLDTLVDSDASVRHKSFVYRFSGMRRHPSRGKVGISIEQYRPTKEPFEEFLASVYHYESDDEDDVWNHLTTDVLWDGKTFYELEKALTWIDW